MSYNYCNGCGHNMVCRYQNDYEQLLAKTGLAIDKTIPSPFEIELRCKFYKAQIFVNNLERITITPYTVDPADLPTSITDSSNISTCSKGVTYEVHSNKD